MRFVLLLCLSGCTLEWFSDHEGNNHNGGGPLPDAPPRPSGPILHYTFDGSLANDGTLGHQLDGTGAAYTFVAGVRGTAIAFDTTRDTEVLLPTQVPMSSHEAYTIGFWFREDTVWDSSPYVQYLFNNRGQGGFQTYHGANGSQALTTCSAAGCQSFGYSVGPWHHLTYRFAGVAGAGAPLEILVDDVVVTQLPASTVYFDSTQTSITLGTRTNMQLDDLRAYSRALSRDEICTEMMGGTFDGNVCTPP